MPAHLLQVHHQVHARGMFFIDFSLWCTRLLAVITAGLSVAIVLAEATISPHVPNLSVFSRALHETAGNELATELLTFVSLVSINGSVAPTWILLCTLVVLLPEDCCILIMDAVTANNKAHCVLPCVQAYPCLCAYYAIYKLGRFSFYMLVPRHTSAYSLLANAMLMSRFAPPLAFNFMAGIALPPSKGYSPGRDVTDTVLFWDAEALISVQLCVVSHLILMQNG